MEVEEAIFQRPVFERLKILEGLNTERIVGVSRANLIDEGFVEFDGGDSSDLEVRAGGGVVETEPRKRVGHRVEFPLQVLHLKIVIRKHFQPPRLPSRKIWLSTPVPQRMVIHLDRKMTTHQMNPPFLQRTHDSKLLQFVDRVISLRRSRLSRVKGGWPSSLEGGSLKEDSSDS